MRRTISLAALLLVSVAGPALGHGYSTHAHLSREAARKLRSDAKLGFLDRDEGLRNCFAWGSVFPDLVNVADAVGGDGAKVEDVRKKVESHAAVKKLEISGQDVKPFGFHTHDRAFAFFLVEKAEQQGDQAFLAFALGNLVHLAQDHHEEMILHPYYMVRSGSGDLGTKPLRDPAALADWSPGCEIGSIFAAMTGSLRSKDEACGVRDLPRKLVSGGSIFTRTKRSLARAAELKHRYYLVAKEWHDVKLGKSGFMTELGFQNTVRLHEVVLTVAPYTEGKESAGSLARVFVDRYVDLAWWADALLFVGNTFTRLVTLGQLDVFKLVAACANADRRVAPAMASVDPVGDITFGFLHGGAAEKDVRAKLANNVEFQRLLASGLLDKGTYSEPYDLGVAMCVDVLRRRTASLWTDHAQWRWDPKVYRGAGVGSLCGLMGPASGYIAEPTLIVSSVRFVDPVTGQDVRDLFYPTDAGRPLRAIVELFAPVRDAQATTGGRTISLTVKSDKGSSKTDPVAGKATQLVPAALLTPTNYGTTKKPVLTVDFVAPADDAQAGVYLEVDAGRGVFFTTNMKPFAHLTAGRPHYAKEYVTYGSYPPAVEITR